MLQKKMDARTGEATAQKLGLGDGEFTLVQANCQAMDPAHFQDVSEMLNMRG